MAGIISALIRVSEQGRDQMGAEADYTRDFLGKERSSTNRFWIEVSTGKVMIMLYHYLKAYQNRLARKN